MKVYIIIENCSNDETRNVACLSSREEAESFIHKWNRGISFNSFSYEEWNVGEIFGEFNDNLNVPDGLIESVKEYNRTGDITTNEYINDFKPFEKVLVRNSAIGLWIPALYGKYIDGKHLTSAGWQNYCMKYEGNEKLLGTTDKQ